MICTAFILAWSPYAVVSMWSACGFHVPNLTSIFTRLFAKSASFYNPLIYFGLSSKFRRDASVLLPCARDSRDTVKLKRFRPKADTHRRLRALNRPDGNLLGPTPGPDTPPLLHREVFYIEKPRPSETGSEFECDRL